MNHMLDEQDKKEIGTIVNSVIDKLERDIILPGFDNVETRLTNVESRLTSVESEVTEIKRKLTTMPNRADIDRAVADIKGEMNEKFRPQ